MNFKLTADEITAVGKTVLVPGLKFAADEARDASGRWTTGSGGGKKPSVSFNREVAIKDKNSAAFGGRLPKGNELKSIHHITSTQTAIKILSSKEGFKSAHQIDPTFAEDSYGKDSDAGKFVYVGLSKEAAENSAVSTGVRFVLNGNPYKDRAIVQPDQEGGIAMFHGSIPRDAIQAVIINTSIVSAKEEKAVLAAWDAYKRERARNSL